MHQLCSERVYTCTSCEEIAGESTYEPTPKHILQLKTMSVKSPEVFSTLVDPGSKPLKPYIVDNIY